jgi:hypothetical protein
MPSEMTNHPDSPPKLEPGTTHEDVADHKPSRSVRDEHASRNSTDPTLDFTIRQRVEKSIPAALDAHSEARGELLNAPAIESHKLEMKRLIWSHEGHVLLMLPENTLHWGIKSVITHDQEQYYLEFFSVHSRVCADNSASPVRYRRSLRVSSDC